MQGSLHAYTNMLSRIRCTQVGECERERNLEESLILLLILMLQTENSFRSVFVLNDKTLFTYLTPENPVVILSCYHIRCIFKNQLDGL